MIVVDTETTGTDPRKHSLLSIGAVDFDDPENEFYGVCRAFDGAKIEKEALEINGFTEEEVHDRKAKSEGELLKAFISWTETVGDKTFAGQNPSFDQDFMKAAADRANINWTFSKRSIDLHSVAYAHMLRKGVVPPSKNGHTDLNLPKILQYCGIPGDVNTHDAHDDALCAAECLSRLIYGKSSISDFERYPVPTHLRTS